MEGFPWGTNPGRGSGRQAAGLSSGSDGVDQAWDLDQPEEERSPEGDVMSLLFRDQDLYTYS